MIIDNKKLLISVNTTVNVPNSLVMSMIISNLGGLITNKNFTAYKAKSYSNKHYNNLSNVIGLQIIMGSNNMLQKGKDIINVNTNHRGRIINLSSTLSMLKISYEFCELQLIMDSNNIPQKEENIINVNTNCYNHAILITNYHVVGLQLINDFNNNKFSNLVFQ